MIDPAAVERELTELWQESADSKDPITRACMMNLVVICEPDHAALDEATQVVAYVSETQPGRALVVAPNEQAQEDLSGFVSAHCHRGDGGTLVCNEQVTLEVRGSSGRRLLPQTLLQLFVEDMPVFLWWRRSLDDDPWLARLVGLADALIVDAARFVSPAKDLERLAWLVGGEPEDRPARAHDLLWTRLDPWREAVASFFDAPHLLARLERMKSVEVASGGPADDGRTAAGAYLVGWLASRLGWDGQGLRWRSPRGTAIEIRQTVVPGLAPGELARVCLGTGGDGDGEALRFVCEREPRESVVCLSVEGRGVRPPAHRLRLPERDEARLLCGVLQASEDERVYAAALEAAARAMAP